ncbi:MAG: DUF4148 domain-containing protein [Rhizobiales bacterium]|nr:DUF4148 domain-containing protein [Rhizobacter sp.]
MTTIRNTTFALALAAAAGGALSQAALTREQIKAELAEAIRTGDIVGNGETGQKFNEMNPGRYPAKQAAKGRTRVQLRAELAEAHRAGDIIGNGETGQRLNEMYPDRYPTKPVVAGKTRDEVKTEFAEAVLTGDIIVAGETGLKANELSPAAYPMQARGRKSPTPATTAQRNVPPAR